MKKVIVVSKTHLDLGFTDYAENIRRKYLERFIPEAIELAKTVNTDGHKNFIWTTGSWIIKEALEQTDERRRNELVRAIKDGDIIAHGLPFTTHTELFDKDTFDFGLSIVDGIDAIRGQKTVSAKMTDVPGHTRSIVPLLAKHGIKLLHIGVNGVSAMPEVPECFLWKNGDAQVVVIYSGDYGGAFKSDLIDEVLYFDHTVDNRGAPSPERVLEKLADIQKEFPDYEVTAGTLDEFAECIWAVKDRLPVFEGEIGDTWIHGAASDPYKAASLRTLMRLKNKWLEDGTMQRMSDEYRNFTDALLCIGEHTCGLDSKMGLADYENYLKSDFRTARAADKVETKHPDWEYPYNLEAAKIRTYGSYSAMEKSWQEQRGYIDKALCALDDSHRAEAESALNELQPQQAESSDGVPYSEPISVGDYTLSINAHGAIGRLTYKQNEIIKENDSPIIEYRSYSKADYDYWFEHYSRNMDVNYSWGYADFGKPLLKYVEGKYPVGRFFYTAESVNVKRCGDCVKAIALLKCDERLCNELGAPRDVQIVYTLSEDGLKVGVSWFGKDANRLVEAIFLHMYPAADDFEFVKLGEKTDYRTTVSMGGRNLNAVEKCIFKTDAGEFDFVNLHSPLISIGRGKILEYDNKLETTADGIAYVLCDNVWGTNFPLWYEDNAKFEFEITQSE